ncbi:motile sperm domain-containing protein 2 isoform X2 [Copidosoma floridanum]|uniref:motile sperm domain-containing protein 2 isoform X2 n=1 Tax=Copidosoma floridanum TaxID=29053 RepID=UPI0006C96B1F|nr:motile sperm domain-containing protein 2 isoform X2 [Copidosoma floridanum]
MVVDEKAQIRELRDKFLSKLKDGEPSGSSDFHPADIERVSSNDDWLRRFLEHNEYNIQDALKMLWESCEWRRNFGTNDITENNVRMDYLEHGVCYSYGKDKDGKKLFVIKSKLHTKGSKNFAELQRCIVYWFERLEREGNGNQISLFFDMIDVGLSNMDMELTKYLIGLFKNYYPNFLNYIIILEMPWILNATFNIIKSWLPAKALPKIKFVKRATLKEYVDPSVALKSWGGNNEYVFKFVPEAQSNGLVNGKTDNKKVHFAENSPLTEQADSTFGDKLPDQALLSVEPEVLTFTKSGNDVISKTITLKNNSSESNVTYKIKTTSPEKFKVRPNTGILLPSQSVSVTITLQLGYDHRSLVPNDRFLIMCLPIENKEMTNTDLIDFWKAWQ